MPNDIEVKILTGLFQWLITEAEETHDHMAAYRLRHALNHVRRARGAKPMPGRRTW